jgi:AsmA protein
MKKRLLIGAAALLGVIVGAAALAPWLVPGSVAKSWAIAVAGRVLGYPVAIAGPFRFSLLPRLAVEAVDVRVAAHGAGTPDLLSMVRFEAEVAPLALLRARIHIGKFVLTDPVLRVAIDADGRSNWRGVEAASGTRPASSWQPQPDPDWGLLKDVRVGDLRLVNGRAIYTDARDGRKLEAHGIQLTMQVPEDAPLTARGEMVVNGRPVEATLDTGPAKRFLSGAGTPVTLGLRALSVSVEYKGTIAKRQFFVAEGDAALSVVSVPELQAWLGRLFPGPVEGSFSLRGRVVINGNRIAAERVELELGATKAIGEVAAVVGPVSPSLQVSLVAENLNLSPFVDADAIARWRPSSEPFTAPYTGDTDVRLIWRSLRLGPLRLGSGDVGLRASRAEQALEVDVSELTLFGGFARGHLRLATDPGKKAALEGRLELIRVAAAALLGTVIENPPFDGKATVLLNVAGAGASPIEVMRSLRSEGTFSVSEGFPVDHRLAGLFDESATAEPRPYHHLTGTFTAADGVFKSPDIVLRAPQATLAASGEIDFATARIDFLFRPLTASAADAAARSPAGPFRIAGPWAEFAIDRTPPN